MVVRYLFAFILMFVFVSCLDKQQITSLNISTDLLNAQKVFLELKDFLTISPRESGTEQSEKAAKYILSKLKSYGLNSQIHYFEEETSVGKIGFRNIVGKLDGNNGKIIILASHYDTKGGISSDFQGANDSGSSTALLLELARIFTLEFNEIKNNNKIGIIKVPTIFFAFLDGEECRESYGPNDGLHGSRYMVEWLTKEGMLKSVIAVIVLDMIGDANLNVELPPNSSTKLVNLVFQSAHKAGVRNFFKLGENIIIDDHLPFLQANVPAVLIIDFSYGSLLGKNDYWHTVNDSIDKISPDSLKIVGDVVINMVNLLANE